MRYQHNYDQKIATFGHKKPQLKMSKPKPNTE